MEHDDIRVASLLATIAERDAIIARARTLVRLVTVEQAVRAGDEAIDAAGLDPWCVAEGRATGAEPVGTWWMQPRAVEAVAEDSDCMAEDGTEPDAAPRP